jgi:hypothetical protein
MDPNILNVTSKQLETFGDVWKELLKQKINIIYKISIDKNEDFQKLLEEFVPEAFDNKELWENVYMINESKECVTESTENKYLKPKEKIKIKVKKFKVKKKIK